MINKNGLWFLALFCLILVLGVYYITMPDEVFEKTNDVATVSKEEKETTKQNDTTEELTTIEMLKQELIDERQKEIDVLEEKISSTKTTKEEKNQAYENIKTINNNKSLESSLEEKIKNKLELESFVKKDNNEVTVIISKKDHNTELASQIMKLVEEDFDNQISVAVKFQS